MEFIQIHSTAKTQIRSYTSGALQINDQIYHNSLIALPDKLILDWPITCVDQLTSEACSIFSDLDCDVLLIGTGPSLIFPAAPILGHLRTQKFGVEFMDTGAACRTFHILLAEQRKVVAALIV